MLSMNANINAFYAYAQEAVNNVFGQERLTQEEQTAVLEELKGGGLTEEQAVFIVKIQNDDIKNQVRAAMHKNPEIISIEIHEEIIEIAHEKQHELQASKKIEKDQAQSSNRNLMLHMIDQYDSIENDSQRTFFEKITTPIVNEYIIKNPSDLKVLNSWSAKSISKIEHEKHMSKGAYNDQTRKFENLTPLKLENNLFTTSESVHTELCQKTLNFLSKAETIKNEATDVKEVENKIDELKNHMEIIKNQQSFLQENIKTTEVPQAKEGFQKWVDFFKEGFANLQKMVSDLNIKLEALKSNNFAIVSRLA